MEQKLPSTEEGIFFFQNERKDNLHFIVSITLGTLYMEAQSLKPFYQPSMVVHISNPRTRKDDPRKIASSSPV